MKQSDVKLGMKVYTYIGQDLCPVEVVGKYVDVGGWNARTKTRFSVRRFGSTSVLPKKRTAAALRVLPVKNF